MGWPATPGLRWSSRPCWSFLLLIGLRRDGLLARPPEPPDQRAGIAAARRLAARSGLGLATGWAMALVCVLPLTIVGGIAISSFSRSGSAWGWLVADAAFFALLALAEEVAFRGYAFQRFIRAVGPSAPRWALPRSTQLCRRSRPAQTTPASPSRWPSACCSPRPICARAPCG